MAVWLLSASVRSSGNERSVRCLERTASSIDHSDRLSAVRRFYRSRSGYLTALDSRELICTGVSICLIISRHVESASHINTPLKLTAQLTAWAGFSCSLHAMENSGESCRFQKLPMMLCVSQICHTRPFHLPLQRYSSSVNLRPLAVFQVDVIRLSDAVFKGPFLIYHVFPLRVRL